MFNHTLVLYVQMANISLDFIAFRISRYLPSASLTPILIKDPFNIPAPSAPQNLTLIDSSSASLTVQWLPPEQLNGVVTQYNVNCTAADDPNDSSQEIVTEDLEAEIQSCTFYELHAERSYIVSVQVGSHWLFAPVLLMFAFVIIIFFNSYRINELAICD